MALAYPEACTCSLPTEHTKFHGERNEAFKRAAPRRSGKPSVKWNAAKDVPNKGAVDFSLISNG
jgi:hypothetical protein